MMLKFVPAALASVLLLAAPAEASPVRSHYAAGELASSSGLESLYARLNQRVDAVCATNGVRGLWLRRAKTRCTEALLADFVEKIGDSGLHALHAQASDAPLLARRD